MNNVVINPGPQPSAALDVIVLVLVVLFAGFVWWNLPRDGEY